MKKSALICFFFLFLGSAKAQVKVPVAKYVEELNKGNYELVYNDIRKFRKTTPYGKSAALDYFEAKCLCLNGTCENAYPIFTKILQCYPLTEKDRDFLYGEMETCRGDQGVSTGISPTVVVLPVQVTAFSASVYGKIGAVTNCNDDSQFMDFSRMPPPDTLLERIFDRDHKTAAVRLWKGILQNQYRIDSSSDRFLIITPLTANIGRVRETIQSLEKAADYFARFYHLSAPEKLITVFMLPDNASMKTVAARIHHLNLPSTNLGYSNLSDLSIVGISDLSRVGTIYHELFHLMVKSDIGDIPVWLDEGLACLYSTCQWNGDTLVGLPTWRAAVLSHVREREDYKIRFPTINLLTGYSWSEFNGAEDRNICLASINYAMANELMLYFQQKGLLQKIVDAYHNRNDVDFKDSTFYPSNQQVLTTAIGESLENLDTHFSQWLQSTLHVDTRGYQVTTRVTPFNTMRQNFGTLITALYIHHKAVHSFDSLQQAGYRLNREFSAYPEGSPYLRQFYLTEEKRLQGLYDPYVKSPDYKKVKDLYDRAKAYELFLRKALFR